MNKVVPTARYREQHELLLGLANDLKGLLPAGDPAAIKAALRNLASRLLVHLAMEDDALYPRLKAHSDPAVRQLASRFQDEMGGIRGVFEAFVSRWQIGEAIARDREDFVREAQGIYQALAARIERENNQLYTLADRVGL